MRSFLKLSFILFLFPFSCVGQNILITYYSESGHTSLMAHAVAEGARQIPSARIKLLSIDSTHTEDLLWADAIIVGSPVHSANIAASVQAFIRNWPFQDQPLKDKVGAAFVTGGGISAGEELAQMNLIHSMMVFNMIIAGGPAWDQPFGASAVTGEAPFNQGSDEADIDPRFAGKGRALGERVAAVTAKFVQ